MRLGKPIEHAVYRPVTITRPPVRRPSLSAIQNLPRRHVHLVDRRCSRSCRRSARPGPYAHFMRDRRYKFPTRHCSPN